MINAGSIKVALETERSLHEQVLSIGSTTSDLKREVGGFVGLLFIVLGDMSMHRQAKERLGRRERRE